MLEKDSENVQIKLQDNGGNFKGSDMKPVSKIITESRLKLASHIYLPFKNRF